MIGVPGCPGFTPGPRGGLSAIHGRVMEPCRCFRVLPRGRVRLVGDSPRKAGEVGCLGVCESALHLFACVSVENGLLGFITKTGNINIHVHDELGKPFSVSRRAARGSV